MTDNPYAAPESKLASSDLEMGDFTVGESFSAAWKACWSNFPQWLGFGLLSMLVSILSMFTVIGYFVVVPVLLWGNVTYLLNLLDGKSEINNLFVGFKQYGKVLGRMLLFILAFILLSVITQSVSIIGTVMQEPSLMTVGSIINLIASIFLLRFYFAIFFMIEKDMPALEALSTSWQCTKGKTLKVILLGLAGIPIMLGGALALGIGVFPAMLIIYLMWASAYRQMVSQ